MLFSSQVFILVFLPLTVAAYHFAGASKGLRLGLLITASLIFYAWWDVRFVPLLIGTVAVNWLLAHWYMRVSSALIIVLGVALNLGVLGFFKYTNFIVESALNLAGIEHQPWTIVLPLGISFFIFQQISYIVDLKRGQAPVYPLLNYAAYVCFFPQLIAGPIVRHNELIPQFAGRTSTASLSEQCGRGALLFILGLVKKVFFADELAPLADAGFALAASETLSVDAAWHAALAYSLQLYFDFSAYSDMALGLAALFGFVLPLNFNNPYTATSIREFWRRWHMTLSRFLRDYVYIPVGGSRGSALKTYLFAVCTMLLCGLWHGAGWTFIVWGGLHGFAVCCNRWWMRHGAVLPAPLAWSLTMLFVVVGWVLFRAEDFHLAARMIGAMFGHGGDAGTGAGWNLVLIGAGLAVVGPTNAELADAKWVPRRAVALASSLLFVATIMRVGQGRGMEFIYFQF